MRNFLLGAFVASAFWLAYHGNAQDWLVVNGIVQHFNGNGYCNSHVTKGLGYERVDGSVRLAVGFYDNSNCAWSSYAAAAWVPLYLQSVNLRVGGIIGGVTGYRSTITPAGGLAIANEGERYGFNVIAIPPLSSSSPGVVWMQFKVRFR